MNVCLSARANFCPRPAPGAAFARVILADHARLPGRFFGRLTAAVPARLRDR
jgi:hypothetical protein